LNASAFHPRRDPATNVGMIVVHEALEAGAVRCEVVRPEAAGPFPAVVLYSDVFQLTPSHRRLAARLAGYGFVVASPELCGRRVL
jgi:dienelactone hydrolase